MPSLEDDLRTARDGMAVIVAMHNGDREGARVIWDGTDDDEARWMLVRAIASAAGGFITLAALTVGVEPEDVFKNAGLDLAAFMAQHGID